MRTKTKKSHRLKRCRKRHVFSGSYCDTCKRLRERARYWDNPESQRERKRTSYRKDHPHAHIRVVREAVDGMTALQQATTGDEECEHTLARQAKPGLFYCFMCDTWLNLDFDPVDPPSDDEGGAPNSGKALAPTQSRNGVGARKQKSPRTKQQQRAEAYHRDESKMVEVQCQHRHPDTQAQCPNTFRVWPQNINLVQFCPQLHRVQHKRELNKQRQIMFRQRRTNQA